MSERERERSRDSENECLCVCLCVKERERNRESENERVWGKRLATMVDSRRDNFVKNSFQKLTLLLFL